MENGPSGVNLDFLISVASAVESEVAVSEASAHAVFVQTSVLELFPSVDNTRNFSLVGGA